MGNDKKTQHSITESVIQFLLEAPPKRGYYAFHITKKDSGSGELVFRDNKLIAAKCGRLKGNGAALILSGWEGATITEIPCGGGVKKNVTLGADTIPEILSKNGVVPQFSVTQDALLKDAIILAYALKYKDAGAKLMAIIKDNRYDYMAWLWYSRLVSKVGTIHSTLNEAYRWGSHDQEIWKDLKKSESLESITTDRVKRCFFCWTPIASDQNVCTLCHSSQVISEDPISEDVNEEDVKKAMHRFHKIFQSEKTSGQLAYVLAVGMHNLGQFRKAYQFIQHANKCSPKTDLYVRSLKTLEKVGLETGILSKSSAPKSADSQPKVQIAPKKQPTLSPGKKIILVVEDSPTSRKVIGMVLKREGLQTLEATTGEEALELAANYSPDLVLLDLMLPDMTGHEVLPKMREYEHMKDVPVVMLTGRKGAEDRMKGLQAGSKEYLTKPFDPQKLTSLIRRYIEG